MNSLQITVSYKNEYSLNFIKAKKFRQIVTLFFKIPFGPITFSNNCFATCESTADNGSSNTYISELE